MALRDLVEGDCAGQSSLIRLASHLTQDRAFRDDGLSRSIAADEFVEQYLDETANSNGPPETFKMDDILREMHKMEQAPPTRRSMGAAGGLTAIRRNEEFAAASQDAAWASQYLASGRHFDVNFLIYFFALFLPTVFSCPFLTAQVVDDRRKIVRTRYGIHRRSSLNSTTTMNLDWVRNGPMNILSTVRAWRAWRAGPASPAASSRSLGPTRRERRPPMSPREGNIKNGK